jgi:uncharacterized DUF497 family protein
MHCCALATPTAQNKHRSASATADEARRVLLYFTSMILLQLTRFSLPVLDRISQLIARKRIPVAGCSAMQLHKSRVPRCGRARWRSTIWRSSFTERGNILWIISARKANQREQRRYKQG